MLKKYLAIYRYMFIRSLQFRTELMIYVVLDVLPFFILLFVWQAVFENKTEINSFTLPQITQYYFLVMLVERMTSTYFENWRSEEIRKGKIDYFLTRPFSYFNEIFSKDIGGKLVSLIISLPGLGLAFFLISFVVPVAPLSVAPHQLTIFLIFMAIGYCMQFMIAFWIVLLTFWFEGSSGLEHFKWITVSLFSGSMIPITFMPEWLQTLYHYLPFKFIFAVPITYLQGSLQLSTQLLLELGVSLALMALLSRVLWKRALYQYASAGG